MGREHGSSGGVSTLADLLDSTCMNGWKGLNNTRLFFAGFQETACSAATLAITE